MSTIILNESDLKALAREGMFVKLPDDAAIPPDIRNRVMHARHLSRYLRFAVALLQGKEANLQAANNASAMSRQTSQPLALRIRNRNESYNQRLLAQKQEQWARGMLAAIAHATCVGHA